jgi:hypothetical protein
MNRRDFLTTLLAIGGAAVIPFKTIEAASPVAIDQAWTALQLEPKLFYVNEWGALSTRIGVEGVHFDVSRAELLELAEVPESAIELVEYIQTTSRLDHVIVRRFEYSDVNNAEDCPYDTWEDWLMGDGYAEIREAVEDWVGGTPDDHDYANANMAGTSGHGDALYFFRAREEISDLVGIFLPKTPNPASFEFAAFLHTDIDAANALLIANNIPIRFEEGLS